MIKSDELILTHDPAPARRRRWSRALGFLALITCPCHVPLLALTLSGTAAGALLAAHFDEAVMLFSVFFLISLCAAIWIWRTKDSMANMARSPMKSSHALYSPSTCTDVASVSNGSPFRGM